MLVFNKTYFSLTIVLFVIEILIALFLNDSFIRPTMGDVLVVFLIYCFLKTIFDLPFWIIALITLVFSVSIETLQYFHIIERLGLENNRLARLIIGTTFTWYDIASYCIGVAILVFVEIIRLKKN